MQVDKTLTQTSGFNKLAAGLLIAAAALATTIGISQITDIDIPMIGGERATSPALVARTSPAQGEGFVDTTASYAQAQPMIRYATVNAGEGLLDSSTLAVAAARPQPIALLSSDAGEGRIELGTVVQANPQVFANVHQGEGLLDPAN